MEKPWTKAELEIFLQYQSYLLIAFGLIWKKKIEEMHFCVGIYIY